MKNLVITLKNGVHIQLYFEKQKEAEEIRDKVLKCKKPFCTMVETATVRVSEIALIEIMDVELEEEK